MARRKHHFGYIQNAAARKLSLKKRKQHILKKVEELTILCGIDGCAVIFSPDEPEPTFWPSQLKVEFMLREYESIPDIEKSSKKVSLETYLRENVKKMEKQLSDVESMNFEMENDHFLNQIYRGGKPFHEFQKSELIGLKEFVEERRCVLGKRMNFHGISINEGDESESDEETAEEPENRIEDPAMEEWFINMTKETSYEASSSSNSVPEKQKAVTDVIDHAAMSTDQGNGINQDSSMFGVNPGQQGVIVATSFHTVEIYTENPQGINTQVVEAADHGNTQICAVSYGYSVVGQQEIYVDAAMSQDNVGGINNGGGGGNNELGVVEGGDNINAAMFPHGNTQGSDQPNAEGFYVGQDDSIKENDSQNLHVDTQGSVTVINQIPELPMEDTNGNGWLPDYGLTEGSHHGMLDFPNNNNMFGETLLSSNSMDIDQPNYVPYATYNDIDGGANMAQHPGN